MFEPYINDVNKLVDDACMFNISKKHLDKWEAEFLQDLKLKQPETIEAENVKA